MSKMPIYGSTMLSKAYRFNPALVAAGMMVLAPAAYAQDDKKDDEKKEKTVAEFVEEFDPIEGLFPLYQDPEDGSLFMEISEDQLGEEFIVYSYTENGVLNAGHFRGAYRDQRIVTFERRYKSIDVVERNTAFYFDPDNALSRASDANISDAVVATLSIKAKTEAEEDAEAPTTYLIPADGLFLSEDLHRIKPTPNPDAPPNPRAFSLGSLSGKKTNYADIRNYPENTDIVVNYVYENPSPKPVSFGAAAVTDARSVTIKMQHSILEMPDDGFTSRLDDYRVGYFLDQVTDLTDPSATPYRDLVNRWRLVKKDPEAELSEPVEPIVWWIENTTPVEYREIIKDATLAWNESFEAAGFKDAIQVKVQPDDADWDAGDIRYNVLRWTSSPIPPFGGYGPSFTNPRTGEILAADIMLEYIFLTNRMVFDDLFSGDGAAHLDHLHEIGSNPEKCDFGLALQQDLMFARLAAMQAGATDAEVSQLVEDGLYYLILHEVGHTLGLNHNMKASQMHDAVSVHDKSITQGIIAGSVMDYPAINVAPLGMEQGDYANRRPGPYDNWAIQFGYDPRMDDTAARAALLDRSTEPELTFGNDADDMRSAGGGGIDPRVMIGDMSSDMITYGAQRTELVRDLLGRIKDKYSRDGESWQSLTNAYLILTGQQSAMARSVSRFVGGVYVERAAHGQTGATQPFTPVDLATQKDAMDYLAENIFAADAFEISADLASHLQRQRRGFNFFGNPEDPKLHDRALSIQEGILRHLTSANVLGRMTNYQNYGGEYTPAEMLLDLNDAVFGDDLRGNPNAYRQNLQVVYTGMLVDIVIGGGNYDPVARSAVLGALMDVDARIGLIAFGQAPDAKAHRAHVSQLVSMALGG